MKFIKLLLSFLALLSFSAFGADYPRPQYSGKATPSDFSQLPKALLSEGQPIDPFCVAKVLMQPQGTTTGLTECAGSDRHVKDYLMYTSEAEKEQSISARALIDSQDLGYLHHCEARYYAHGVLNRNVLVKIGYQCEDTYKEPMILGLIERKNDFLINRGVISQGDHCRSGYTRIDSFDKGILRYQVVSPASNFFATLLNHASKDQSNLFKLDYLSHTDCYGWIQYTLDLNKSIDSYKPAVRGVRFNGPIISLGNTKTTTKMCLNKTIDKFVYKKNLSTIPVEKFSVFQSEVAECVGPPLPTPKETNPHSSDVDI